MRRDGIEQTRRQSMEDNGFGPRVMMGLKVCARCGAVGQSSQHLCRSCGGWLPRRTLYQWYKEKHRCCPLCDTVVSDGARYCPQCGTALL